MAYDIPSISDLEAIQLLNKHYAEVVTSKKDGIASGLDITQTTNPITGVVRRTLYKILDDMDETFLERLLKMAFTPVGTFTDGATLTDARQTLLWEVSEGGDGRYYSWSGAFGTSGKVVSAGSSPSPIAAGSWVDRTDDSLRDEIRETVFQNMKRLYAEAGFNLVDGSFQMGGSLSGWPDVLWDWATGVAYQWHLDEAKTVPAGSTPATTGGIGAGAWVDRTDVTLRSELLHKTGLTTVDLINSSGLSIKTNEIIQTTGFNVTGIGSAKWMATTATGIASKSPIDLGELKLTNADGIVFELVHEGVVTLEQIGAIGGAVHNVVPSSDDWVYFNLCYKLKKANPSLNVKFVATRAAYFVSKPVMICTSMSLVSANNSLDYINVYYSGGYLTSSDIDIVAEIGGNFDYKTIQAQVIAIPDSAAYCRFAELKGFRFLSSINGSTINYGLCHRYLNRSNIIGCKFEDVKVGQFGLDVYSNKFSNLGFTGVSSIPSDSIMVNIYPRGGYGITTLGSGTSNIWERCGGKFFKRTWELVNHHYSKFTACYSESGVDIVMNMIRCKGIVFDVYGVENAVNVTQGMFRCTTSEVVINGLSFSYNNSVYPDALFNVASSGNLKLGPISFYAITSSSGNFSLAWVDSTSKLDAWSVSLPPGATLGNIISGLLLSDKQVTSSNCHITNSAGVNVVTETFNKVKYVHNGKIIEVSIEITWTSSSSNEALYISVLPYASERSISVSGFANGFSLNPVFVCSSSESQLRAINPITGAAVAIPNSGSVILNFSYQRA